MAHLQYQFPHKRVICQRIELSDRMRGYASPQRRHASVSFGKSLWSMDVGFSMHPCQSLLLPKGWFGVQEASYRCVVQIEYGNDFES